MSFSLSLRNAQCVQAPVSIFAAIISPMMGAKLAA